MVWIASSSVERVVMQNTKYVASNASRVCRQLAIDGLLQREERPFKGKTLAYYRYNPATTVQAIVGKMDEWWKTI